MDQQLIDALIDRDAQIERQAATIKEQDRKLEGCLDLITDGMMVTVTQQQEIVALKEVLAEGVAISQENLVVLEAAQAELDALDQIIELAVVRVKEMRQELEAANFMVDFLTNVLNVAADENNELREQLTQDDRSMTGARFEA